MRTLALALPFALAIAFFGTATALAQSADNGGPQPDNPAPPNDDPEIVVQAPVTPNERRIQLREMVTDIINQPRAGRSVATYFEAICPRVIGLPEAESRVIIERIAENAETLGVNRRNPTKNCSPNLTVIFVAPSAGPPEAWLTEENDMLQHLLSYQRAGVLDEHDPVRAWTVNVVRNVDGTPQRNDAGQQILGPLSFGNPVRLGSRLRSNSPVEITGAVVMFELTKAAGKTLGQLADYASMRTFGNTRGLAADAVPVADTILTLFRDENPPEQLTTFDRALISKLYDTSRNSRARRYYSNIAGRALELENAEGEQTP